METPTAAALAAPLLLPHQQEGRKTPRPAKASTRSRVVFVPFSSAVAEASSYPHRPDCVHCNKLLVKNEARWGSGLCDACYERCQKTCTQCGGRLAMRVLHWNSGLCDSCYDTAKHQSRQHAHEPLADGFDAGVKTVIGGTRAPDIPRSAPSLY